MRGVDPRLAERYHRLGYWENQTFCNYLERNIERWPDRLAVIDSTRRVTWREMGERVERTAAGLLHLGVQAGDTVAVQIPNRVEFFYLRFALQRIGARALTLAADLREGDLAPALRAAGCWVVVTPLEYRGFNYFGMFHRLREHVPTLKQIVLVDDGESMAVPSISQWIERADITDLAAVGPGIGPNEVDLLMLTSGTTGMPKLCGRTANVFAYRARTMNERIGLTAEDRLLSLAPITQGIGQLFGLACFMVSGATLVLLERFAPEEALRAIEREEVTVAAGVPTHALRMMACGHVGEVDLRRLRLFVLGAAGCPPAKQRELERTLGCATLNYYGMAEIGIPAIPFANDPPSIRHETSGRILPGMEVKFVDEDGSAMAPGECGEVLVRGPGVSMGYLGDNEGNDRLFDAEGWGHTGDLGYLDRDNILHVVGRKKDIIIRGGLNIVPREIEDLIASHPSVRQVAVIGLPDPELGERACVVAALRPGHRLALNELVDFLRTHEISTYKLPERLEIVDELPVTAIGKIDRRNLR
ncbi:MAG: AMP-binding protein, partial [Betaproteobacteria bacterium]|nr:AMP-binding protein [Betaproteobacteria bacterium]